MPDQPAITIPRQGESDRAYRAKVEYVTLGSERSLERLRQKLGKRSSYIRQLQEWSSQYGWVDAARQYDDTVLTLRTVEAAEQYRRDLEAHRADAMRYGQALCGVAVEMLTQLRGVSKSIEYSPAALATIARALTTGLDLRAHALDLDRLLPTLTPEGARDE